LFVTMLFFCQTREKVREKKEGHMKILFTKKQMSVFQMRIWGDDLTCHSSLTQGKGLCRRYAFQVHIENKRSIRFTYCPLKRVQVVYLSCTQTSFRPLIIERKQTNESQKQRKGFLDFPVLAHQSCVFSGQHCFRVKSSRDKKKVTLAIEAWEILFSQIFLSVTVTFFPVISFSLQFLLFLIHAGMV